MGGTRLVLPLTALSILSPLSLHLGECPAIVNRLTDRLAYVQAVVVFPQVAA